MKRVSLFYRIASVLLVMFAAGHTIGFLKFKPPTPESALVWAGMNKVLFPVGSGQYTYAQFYKGFGLFATAYLLFAAYLSWHLGNLVKKNPQAIGSLGWAFFALQVGSIVLSAVYFLPPPVILSAMVAVCAGLAAWGAPKSEAGFGPRN